MLSLSSFFKVHSIILFIWVTNYGVAQNINITIPLNKTTIFRDKQLYGDFITLNRTSMLQVDFTEIKKNLSFVIFQVHSHLYNVSLYKNVKNISTIMRGTNLGLHSEDKFMEMDKFFVENVHTEVDLKLYIAVHGYFKTDPMPGGCNQEFPPVPVVPTMRVIDHKDFMYVDAAPARTPYDDECNLSDEIRLRFFMVYLPAGNFDSDVYFDGIIDMMNLKGLRNKRVISPTVWMNRRMISTYAGTGAIYVAVANHAVRGVVNQSRYSVYVPATSYGCCPLEDNCDLLEDTFSEFACASLFFIGIFICYYGHRFFKIQILTIGFLSGLVVAYIVVSLINSDLKASEILALSMICGLCVGATRLVYWWIYGLPVFSIILSSADVGFIVSCLIFYSISDDWAMTLDLNLDTNYWSLFVTIIALVTIILLLFNNVCSFICCAVIGAYATILPIDFYLGTHLKYILIYNIRRATVPSFHKAVKMTTYQWTDGMLLTVWVCLAFSGFLFQLKQNQGRPPFPPPPRSAWAAPEVPAAVGPGYRNDSLPNDRFNERTPLLS